MRAVSAALAALLLAACGSDDGGRDGRQEPAPDRSGPRPPTARLDSKAIGFTFEYPKRFAVRRGGGALVHATRRRGDLFNGIKVRRVAGAKPPRRYVEDFRRDFAREVGDVEQRRERFGRLDVAVLEFTDDRERRGERVAFTSTSHFFSGAGGTWQVECVADEKHLAQIRRACRTALSTVRFRG